MLNPFTPSTPAADEKAQTLVNTMGHRFADELMERRGKVLKADFKYDTGEIWDGVGAKEIGLVDEIGTIESVASKHPDAKIYDFGPGKRNSGIFSSSVGEWANQTMTTALTNILYNSQTPELR